MCFVHDQVDTKAVWRRLDSVPFLSMGCLESANNGTGSVAQEEAASANLWATIRLVCATHVFSQAISWMCAELLS